MNLRHLIVGIDTFVSCAQGFGEPVKIDSIGKCLSQEKDFPLDKPLWFDSLLTIKSLESMTIWWSIDKGYLRRTARCLHNIQTKMLQNKPSSTEMNDATGELGVEFYARILSGDSISLRKAEMTKADAALSYNPVTDELGRRDCTLAFGGDRFVEVNEEECGTDNASVDDDTYTFPAAVPIWAHPGATVYCKLSRK